ncbi:MAG: ABC transporter substrate-binding protein [Methanomicrobium sp.]|nr:ABC transporter substrate-binding protein [Methanomicrobium sp.]
MALLCPIAAADSEELRSFTDDCGRTMMLPVTINNVSPSGPLAQIVLYSIDPDLLVSIASSYSDDQLKYIDPRVAGLPVTGQFYGAKSTMNPEEIMEMDKKLGISLVLDTGEAKATVKEDLDAISEQTGINFAFVTQNKLHQIADSYLVFGDLLGRKEECAKLSGYVSNLMNEFDSGMAKVGDGKKSIIYVTAVKGNSVSLVGSGEKSYHGEVVNMLGNNLAKPAVSSGGNGDEYTTEDILNMNPDIIIVSYAPNHAYYNEIMNSAEWQLLDAVKSGNVYEAPYGPYSWMGGPPSVQRLLSMIWIGNLMYPDVFDYDVKERAKEFYELFFHYKLSDEELKELMIHAERNAGSPSNAPSNTPSNAPSDTPATSSATSSAKSPAPLAALIVSLIAAAYVAKRR